MFDWVIAFGKLPAGFLNPGQKACTGQFPEMDSAQAELADVSAFAAAQKTPPYYTAGKFGFLI
jgi:hypothetical protein